MSDDTPRFVKDFWPDKPAPRPAFIPSPSVGVNAPYARAALDDELGRLGAAPEGQRNRTLNVSAFNLAQLVAGGLLDRNEVWDALRIVAVGTGLTTSETDKTLHSAFRAGEAQPRTAPEQETLPPATIFELTAKAAEEEDRSVEQMFPVVDWHDLWNKDEEEEWIIEPLLPARRLVALYSAPKVGKSLLMLEMAVAIARGTTILGHKPDRPRRVLYIDFENDLRGDVRTRLQAMGYKPDELADLLYLSFPSLPFLDTVQGGLMLLAIVRHYGVEVVVIDTVSRAVGGEENENDTWLNFYRHTGRWLKAEGVACMRLDHTGKDPTKGMRGGSAKYGDVDAVWSMTSPSPDRLILECTANRLPIPTKVLSVHRRTIPRLLHEVTGGGQGAAITAEVTRCVEALSDLGVPQDAGLPTVLGALEDNGLYPKDGNPSRFTRTTAKAAMEYRQEHPEVTTWKPSDALGGVSDG